MTTHLTHPIPSFSVRPTTPDEKALNRPYITASMLEAVNTCPRWGIIHNVQRKSFVVGYRQMALEFGSAMHEVFSILNLLAVGYTQNLPDHATYHGIELFGSDRWSALKPFNAPDISITHLEKTIFEVIATADFYDEPNDKNRTVANMERCALELLHYWNMKISDFPIYIENRYDPSSKIGIEMSIDVVFSYKDFSVRFIGLLDTLYQNPTTLRVTPLDYKTSSNMNDAWRLSFKTRHQLSGYHGALHAFFDDVSDQFLVLGSAVPVRQTSAPCIDFPVHRYTDNIIDFIESAIFTLEVMNQFADTLAPTAPMFTHSCYRYFRPCGFLDLCSASHEDKLAMYEQMLIMPELSPSEAKALMRRD